MKPILPSLKERKKFLVFKVISNKKIQDLAAVSKEVSKGMLSYLGELGCAKAGLDVMKWDVENQTGIIRVQNNHVNDLKAGLSLIKTIGDNECMIVSKGISGIMKKTARFTAG